MDGDVGGEHQRGGPVAKPTYKGALLSRFDNGLGSHNYCVVDFAPRAAWSALPTISLFSTCCAKRRVHSSKAAIAAVQSRGCPLGRLRITFRLRYRHAARARPAPRCHCSDIAKSSSGTRCAHCRTVRLLGRTNLYERGFLASFGRDKDQGAARNRARRRWFSARKEAHDFRRATSRLPARYRASATLERDRGPGGTWHAKRALSRSENAMNDDQNANRLDLNSMDRTWRSARRRDRCRCCRRRIRLRLEKWKSSQGLQRKLPPPRRSAEQRYSCRCHDPVSLASCLL